MALRALSCHLKIGARPCCPGRSNREYALDYNGQCPCKVLYRFHRDAPECKARVSVPRTKQDYSGFHLSSVTSILFLIFWLKFFFTESGLQALDASQPETSSKPMMRRVIYDRLHYLLRHLLSLIPTLPSALQPLLVRRFPHKRQSHVAQATYVRNLLRVTEYCPELADRILAIIIDHAIQIDVCVTSSRKFCDSHPTAIGRDPGRARRIGRRGGIGTARSRSRF